MSVQKANSSTIGKGTPSNQSTMPRIARSCSIEA